jgi:hypothetical protein
LIKFLQFLDPAKGNPVNNRVIHAHHECRRRDSRFEEIVAQTNEVSTKKATQFLISPELSGTKIY